MIPLALVVGIWGFASANEQIPILIDSIVPGAASAQSRVELSQQGVSLLADAPFTGIGLGSFPGQYSRYILVISEFFYGYAHNLFLDIALAQSPFGLLAFLAIMAASFGLLLKPASSVQRNHSPIAIIRAAILASMIIILVHGLIDDPIYSGRGAVFLLFIPGLAMASLAGGTGVKETPRAASNMGVSRFASVTPLWVILSGLVITLVLLGVGAWPSLTSVWESNLASIKQARSDLVQRIVFDINKFPNDSEVEQSLLSSIELDEKNRTAYHRLGMLSFRHGAFDQAARYLEFANRLDPKHPGIEKALGYAYTWKGELDQAYEILREYPETNDELGLYAQWWLTQDRTDLANYAAQVEAMLGK
jgi:tetratricopeptide (TPR) repeat protein